MASPDDNVMSQVIMDLKANKVSKVVRTCAEKKYDEEKIRAAGIEVEVSNVLGINLFVF